MNDQRLSPYLAQHIRDALAHGTTAELGVDVNVTPSGIYLTGAVSSAEHRDELGTIARREAAGLPVHNDVVVVPTEPDDEVEVLS